MDEVRVFEELKNHEFFKRVKDTGYNYSFYFSSKKNEHVQVEAMIGISKDKLDAVMWRYSIFEKGLLLHSINSIQHDIEEAEGWFKTLVLHTIEQLYKKQ